jgi:hypothetical protein
MAMTTSTKIATYFSFGTAALRAQLTPEDLS